MLGRIALRMATVYALRGKTLAGDNVLDSRIAALDTGKDGGLKTDETSRFIAVYTDASSFDGGVEFRGLHNGGDIQLIIEMGITATMAVRDENDDATIITGIPAADDSFEFYLDIVGREIINALTDSDNPWAEIWRGLSTTIAKIERRRAAYAGGERIAAHQLILTVPLMPDPVFGEAIADGSIWQQFFAALSVVAEEDDVAAEKLNVMRKLVKSETVVAEHDTVSRRFGMTEQEADALLLTPAIEGAGNIASIDFEVF